jgi:hypothetical protein
MKNLHKGELGPLMASHHYRCQHVYIASKASKRIMDTLEFFPHTSPMPQLSSAYKLIMAANDMADALKHPHPYVPFNSVGYDTLSALTTLAAIFKRNYNKTPAPHLIDSPIKAAENKCPAVLIQPELTSPIKKMYQKISQTQVNTVPSHVSESQYSSQILRVVTPATRISAPPRVPERGATFPPETCPKETSGTWAAPTTPYIWAITIGQKHQ